MAWQEFIEWMRFNHLPTSEEATTVGQKKLNATEDLRHATHLGATENSNKTNQRLLRCPNLPDTKVRDGTVHGAAWFRGA